MRGLWSGGDGDVRNCEDGERKIEGTVTTVGSCSRNWVHTGEADNYTTGETRYIRSSRIS